MPCEPRSPTTDDGRRALAVTGRKDCPDRLSEGRAHRPSLRHPAAIDFDGFSGRQATGGPGLRDLEGSAPDVAWTPSFSCVPRARMGEGSRVFGSDKPFFKAPLSCPVSLGPRRRTTTRALAVTGRKDCLDTGRAHRASLGTPAIDFRWIFGAAGDGRTGTSRSGGERA